MKPLRDLTGDEAADALGIDRTRFGPPLPFVLKVKQSQQIYEMIQRHYYGAVTKRDR